MTRQSTQAIIDAELHADETLLWAHVISDDDILIVRPKVKRLLIVLSQLLWCVVAVNSVWQMAKAPPELVANVIKFHLPILVLLTVLVWVLTKTKFGINFVKHINPPIYKNAIVTDHRVLLFNHFSQGGSAQKSSAQERQEFMPWDIADIRLDYENGGRALRFRPRKPEKDSVLIGIVDFQAALTIIQSRLLNKGSAS